MKSRAATPEAYVTSLPEDRSGAIHAGREIIPGKLSEGYGKGIDRGGTSVPFRNQEDLPPDALGRADARMPIATFLEPHRKSRMGKSGASNRVRTS